MQSTRPKKILWSIMPRAEKVLASCSSDEIVEHAVNILKNIKSSLPNDVFTLSYKDRYSMLPYVSFDKMEALAFFKTVPVVKEGDFPTEEELQFPIFFTSHEMFPHWYDRMYYGLIDFLIERSKPK